MEVTLNATTQFAPVILGAPQPGTGSARYQILQALGFSVERLHEINPRLVVLSISGFGHDGPQGGRAGYDQIAQGEAGLMSLTGPSADEPTRKRVQIYEMWGNRAVWGLKPRPAPLFNAACH